MVSHVGQVIMSTTLDTADKVAKVYGGKWEAWGAGRVPVGVNASDSDFSTPGKTGGVKTVTLTNEQVPTHSHTVSAVTDLSQNTTDFALKYSNQQNWSANVRSLTTSASGGGKPHQNMPPYQTLYIWERVS